MKKPTNYSANSEMLRQKAEELLKINKTKKPSKLTDIENLKLVHELQVHQIELEMQNEELQMAKEAAEIASQKYSELFDFAPSGFFSLTRDGKIIESNFCGSRLLGKNRSELKNNSFGLFISPVTKPIFNHFLWNIFNKQTQETCEVTLSRPDNLTKYVSLTGSITLNGSQCIVNMVDITDQRQAGEALRISEEKNRSMILQTAMDGFWRLDNQGRLLEVNETYCKMSGYSMEELLAMNISGLEVAESVEDTAAHIEKVILKGEDRFETRHRSKDGNIFDVEISTQYQHLQGGGFVAFLHDITERKMAERYKEMAREILQILNDPGNIPDLMQDVLAVLKAGTGFDAVGIRLEEGDDFPFVSQSGFSRDFLLTENTLIDRTADGGVCRDKDGKILLSCTCGLVISGKEDPENPFCTPGGSWWTNDSFSLLNIPPERDARFHPRNKCIHQGYASVALVPIRRKDKIVGLIQLNDLHKDRFNENTIEKLEGIASHIGAAIMRKHAEETLRESEKRRLAILETAMDGFWLLDMQGRLLEVNETYCRMSGYSKQELHSMHISDVEVIEGKVDISAHLQKIIAKGDDRFESRHRRKDGSTFDVEVSIQYQLAEGGQFVTFLHDITERKLAEENLRQSEERYKILFQGNHSVMLLIDPETGEIKDANPAACKYYGWTHTELTRKNISEINTLEKEDIKTNLQNSKAEINNHLFFQHRLSNGETRSVEVYSGPIKFGDSMLLYYIIHDITDSKLAQDALIESELKFRKYIDHAPHGIFVANEKGDYADVNSAASEITGFSKDELLSMKIIDMVPEKALQDAGNHFKRVVNEGFATGEFPFIRKDGSIGYWSVDAVKLSDTSFLGFVADVSMRKKAEESLIESEHRYHSLFEQGNDAIFLVDLATGRYLDCNRMAETLTGYTHDEILQMSIGALLPIPRKVDLASNMETMMSGKVLRGETMIAPKDGELIPIEFNASMITINERQSILSMVRDISERNAAEEALRQSDERVRFKLQSILSPEGSISDLELYDIIDVPSIQKLMDNFYELVQIPLAIIDIKGKVLVGVGWQNICTKFHRVHSEACRNCIESDLNLTHGIPDGEFRLYKCKNNMWDIATPIIIGEEHKGNLFMGQFFFDSEPIDIELFQKQADQYGFAEHEYLDALKLVPRISKQKLDHAKSFFLILSKSISQLSYSNIKLARAIAQQKIIEDALRESEGFLNKAQEIAHLGSWTLDLNENRLTWSDEIYRIFGLEPQEFSATYEGFLEAIHPEDRDAVNLAYSNSIKDGKDSYEIEHRIIRRNSGEVRHVFEKCEHIRDASGKIIQSVGMVHDITERVQSAEAIMENERLLRESQAVGNIGSYSVDLVNRKWKASSEVYKIFGIDKTHSNSLDGWVESLHPEFRNELVDDLFNGEPGKEKYEHEYKIFRINDKQERWVSGLGKFEYDGQTNPVRLIGTIQDITERKLKEEALRKLNQTLSALGKSSQAMAQASNEADYLKQVCKIVIDDTDFAMVWIGFAEEDEAKTVRPVANAGFNENYFETIKLSWGDNRYGHGPTGVAIRTGKMSVCNNMLTDPDFEPWREQAMKNGYASSIVFPLKRGNTTFGAISIYSKETNSFLPDEIKLLDQLANDLAHGITTIRLQKAHQLAEAELAKSHSELEALVRERTKELEITNDLLVKEIDISKQQEQSLKLAEEKYRTVADHTHGWEFWLDKDDNFIYCSPSCERITGYESAEFLKNPRLLFEIIHPDDLKGFQSHKKTEGLCQIGNHEFQYRIVRNDGSIRWIGHECQPIYDESNNFKGVRGSNRDISERKNIDQLLETSNRKYRLLSENITDGIFICREGSFEYVNDAMNHIFGYSHKELIGSQINRLVQPEYLGKLDFIYTLTSPNNQISNVELECSMKDGSIIFVEFLFNYVARENVIYGVVHDITEKRQIQKNIVKAIILTEEKERAHFSKELHDGLGPLLSTIKLYLQWSERSTTNESRQEIIGKAEEIVEDAISSVKEISNKLSPHLLTNYGLCSAIHSFINKLEEISAIQIEFNCSLIRRLGNEIEAAVYRAIIECINNTIKHSGAKNINIYMCDTGNQLEVKYQDDGKGFNIEETIAMKKGLGLFNLQNRIQNIGGKITLFSQPGMGVDYRIIVDL